MDEFKGKANCDLLINNICEVFNRQFLDARDSPVITALEYVKEYLMKSIVIVPKVNDGRQNQVVVNLANRSCSCRKWEVSGIPCKHVVACIFNMTDNGIEEKSQVPSRLIPPYIPPQVGRPSKKRKKSVGVTTKKLLLDQVFAEDGPICQVYHKHQGKGKHLLVDLKVAPNQQGHPKDLQVPPNHKGKPKDLQVKLQVPPKQAGKPKDLQVPPNQPGKPKDQVLLQVDHKLQG
ncbi:RNA-directed DNA polymerase, eukaryota [Tanacetum coccineum]